MSTTDTLPQGLQGHEINRTNILTSRGHNHPGTARDALAEWAYSNGFNAIVGVRFIAIPEVAAPEDVTTVVRWAAYGTAIGW